MAIPNAMSMVMFKKNEQVSSLTKNKKGVATAERLRMHRHAWLHSLGAPGGNVKILKIVCVACLDWSVEGIR